MVNIGSGIVRILNRLAIEPSATQAQLAKYLSVSRSAINQHWNNMESQHHLRVRSNLDYGALGFQFVFGWCVSGDEASLDQFQKWLVRNPFTTSIHRSLMSSRMDFRVFFQAIVPNGKAIQSYLQSIERFEKRPYSLNASCYSASALANYLNFGYFDGIDWSFDSGYRFEASIDAAKRYASVLPEVKAIAQTKYSDFDIIPSLIGSALETDYHHSATSLIGLFDKHHIDAPSERTLRRRLYEYRKSLALAHIDLDNIGLTKTVIITLEDSQDHDNYKLLQAQSTTLPKVRVLTSSDSLALILTIPQTSDWFHLSSIMSNVLGPSSNMCTFIAEELPFRRWFEDVISYRLEHLRHLE
ncbi:MAG: hypothetical protein ACFFED_00630 [Candidatus Thorarchaeota archaeon]